ncbi:MAG: hypothetical protein AAGA42_16730 [Actinomycetota bacterium]
MNRPGDRCRRSVVAAIALTAATTAAACGDEQRAEPTAADYIAELETICTETAAELDALPEPPELISVTDFADQAASILAREADQVRALAPPRIDDLDDDHRAFVRNTDDQAATWAEVATTTATDPDADLSPLTTLLGQLALGRDELAAEMGAPACQRVATSSPATTDNTSNSGPDSTASTAAAPGSDS